ncbi:MAG: O-antigen ligase family protein [Bdellovibrionia bacterium]
MPSTHRQSLLTLALCVYAVSTLISMAVMSIGTALLVVALLWAFGGPKALWAQIREDVKTSVWARRYLWVSIALALSCFGSLVWAKLAPLSYGGKSADVHVLKDSLKLWYLFWPLPLAAGLKALSPERRMKILTSWIATCAVLGVIAVIQHFTGWPRPQGIPSPTPPLRYHATLFLGHHLSVASILIFPFFASLDFFKRKKQWLWGLAAALGATALFLTYSRTLWAALPLAIFTWLVINLPKRAKVAVVVLFVLGIAGASQLPQIKARFSAWDFQYSVTTRADLWKANLEFLKERPLLGVGWKHNQELSGYYLMEKLNTKDVFSGHAHNNLLDMLGGTGIAGALSWLAWSLLVIAMAWAAMRRRLSAPDVFASGLLCAWIAFQLNGVTQVNFWEAKVTHQAMWMVAWSLLWLERREEA